MKAYLNYWRVISIKPVIIFGAGYKGNMLINRLRPWQSVAYLADNDVSKIGTTIRGIKVISYQEMLKIKDDYDIILSTGIKDMEQQLAKDEAHYFTFFDWQNQDTGNYFHKKDVIAAMDAYYYDKWRYEREHIAFLFPDYRENWYRCDAFSDDNSQNIARVQANYTSYLGETCSHNGIYEDEKFENRPSMRLIHNILCGGYQLKILDLACGHGALIQKLKDEGHLVLGADCNPNRVEYLRNQGIQAICGQIENINVDTDYDVIILLETLEHVRNVSEIIDKAAGMLKAGGSIFVSVPWGKACDCNSHVRQFTENSLAALFLNRGWDIVNVQRIPYINSSLPYDNILLQDVKI